MNTFRYSTLLIISILFSLYSQTNNVLLIRSNGAKYKKLEMGIKSAIDKNTKVTSTVFSNENDITNHIRTSEPKIVIVTGMDLIKVWRKIQQENRSIGQIPSILLENEFFVAHLGDLSNSCIISYEPKLENYTRNFSNLTGRKPRDIGVVHTSKSRGLIKSYQNESSVLGVNLHAKAVIASDPHNSIKTIVDNFTDHYHVDLMIILDDNVIINNRNIKSTWVSLLSPLNMQIAVPSDYFYDLEPRIGTFSIQPLYSEIGRVIASVINEASNNDWVIRQKSIHADKSVFYFRNKNGSISKKNQIQNEIIASYHPERILTAQAQAQASSRPQNLQSSQQVTSDNKQPDSESKKISEQSTAVEKKEMSPSSSAAEPHAVASSKKSASSVSESLRREKKVQRKVKKQKPFTKKQPSKEVVSSKNIERINESEQSVPQRSSSGDYRYDVVVTAETTTIYKELTSERPILGVGRSGDKLKVTSEDSLWYLVEFSGTTGFLLKEDARTLSLEKDVAQLSGKNKMAIMIASIAALSVLFIILLITRIKNGKKKKIDCLLITKRKTKIKYSNINNKHITLIKYLKYFGFEVRVSKNIDQISSLLLFRLPDIIFVDWKIDEGIQHQIYDALKDKMFTEDYILVFYNVTNPSDVQKDESFNDRTFFLSSKCTIPDLNKILLLVKVKFDTPQQISDQSDSCLEGKVTEETLSEIFHMMDINKKTGCLLVKNIHPVGIVFFEDGIITYAMTNSKAAEQAVFDILSVRRGSFHFVPGKKPTKRQMDLDVMSALMANAKFIDESLGSSSILLS